MGAADYLVGRRVYNGAGNAPTRGTVDPLGYVERGLNNPSQKRSGLAQAALSRLAPGLAQRTVNPHQDPNMHGSAYSPTQAGMGNAPSGTVSGGGQIGPTGTASATMAPGSMTPNALQMSPTGSLRANPVVPENALPFDATADAARTDLFNQRGQFEQGLGQEKQRIEREWTNRRRATENEVEPAARQLLEGFAGRGMAYSSGYGYEQGEQQRQFANMLAQLDQERGAGLADLQGQEATFMDGYNSNMSAIERAAAARLAEQAELYAPPIEPGPEAEAPALGPNGETEQDRLMRMVYEVLGGQRDFNGIRQSVDRLAGAPVGDYSAPNADAEYMTDSERAMERIRAIFGNRGVSLGKY